MTHVVTPTHFPRPRGYSNGIVSSGRTLHISGQIAWDKDARIVSTDFATQFLQALDNVIAVVREAGGGTDHIVKLLVFVTDLEAYRAATRDIGEGWRGRMGKHYPAMSLVKVAGLLEPGANVEIEGVAMLPERASLLPPAPAPASPRDPGAAR
jgi:enamine deaminase RidA (YjgF/YER057c/UK114 family)